MGYLSGVTGSRFKAFVSLGFMTQSVYENQLEKLTCPELDITLSLQRSDYG